MAEPARVQLKRKATDAAPSILVVQSRKKQRTAVKLHYVREQRETEQEKNVEAKEKDAPTQRLFQLSSRKRKNGDEDVVTVVEKRSKSTSPRKDDSQQELRVDTPPQPSFKRPSKRAAVQISTNGPPQAETAQERQRMEELAEYMHQAALEEMSRDAAPRQTQTQRQDTSPKQVAAPRISGEQSRRMHQRRAVTNGSLPVTDAEMEDDAGYVYDTYVLAPVSELDADQMESISTLQGVGYIVMTEEDEALWDGYVEDEPSDKDWNSEEEDENAEDYYGADYPEHELDSEDEFDRNAYEFRQEGVDEEEEWDEDTGAFSDAKDVGSGDVFKSLKYKETARQFQTGV